MTHYYCELLVGRKGWGPLSYVKAKRNIDSSLAVNKLLKRLIKGFRREEIAGGVEDETRGRSSDGGKVEGRERKRKRAPRTKKQGAYRVALSGAGQHNRWHQTPRPVACQTAR